MGRILFAVFLAFVLANPVAAAASVQQARPMESTPGIVFQTVSQAGCGAVEGDQYWFCRALTDGDCGVVASDRYWACKAITTAECGLVADSGDYWFCKGLTTASCSLVASDRYWLCEGVVRGDCTLVQGPDYWLCPAYQAAVRRLTS